jgi:tetratricopeptide (TPR) repeat protein
MFGIVHNYGGNSNIYEPTPNLMLKSQVSNQILFGPYTEAQEILRQTLIAGSFDKVEFGKLAVELFSFERYQLAAMIFRHWTEQETTDPEPWSNLGLALSRAGELLSAQEALLKALEINPSYIAALNNLAGVYQFLGEYDSQLRVAQLAIKIQPDSAVAMNNFGTALLEHGRLEEAKVAFQKSIFLDSGYFEPRFNLARVASDQERHLDAIEFLESALNGPFSKIRHYREMIEYHLSFEYLILGRLHEGWNFYERGFANSISPKIARMPHRKIGVPLWNGEPLSQGEHLMVWREQGVGDEIRFASLIPLLPQSVRNNLVLECDQRLVNLFARSMPEVRVRAESQTTNDFSYHLPIGSLPRLLMSSVDILRDASPLLHPDPSDVAKFAARLAEFKHKKLIGICWRSHKLSATRNKKYTALEDWQSVLSIPGAVYVNLQYGECEEEIQQVESALGIRILRWPDLDMMNDFSGVAGLIKNLDLVVSISSAVVPLAGAVGTPTICMTRQNWVLLGEANIYPWFPSVKPIVVPHGEAMAAALPKVEEQIGTLQVLNTRQGQ